MKNSMPFSEEDRLKSLEKYFLDDTSSDVALNKIVKIASVICGTQIAAVSILERDRQWFKAKVGTEISETPREYALCNYTIKGVVPVVVEDTSEDDRFKEHPLVINDPKVRFYAASPIITLEGDILGTVCAVDFTPKSLSTDKIEMLEDLADLARHTIEAHRKAQLLIQLNQNVATLGSLLPVCYKCKSVKTGRGKWELLETFLNREFGTQLSHGICKKCASES